MVTMTKLDDAERGVQVSNETDDDDGEYLLELETRGRTAEIRTNRHHYNLDLAQVEEKEIQDMKRVLETMNFDQRFLLKFDKP